MTRQSALGHRRSILTHRGTELGTRRAGSQTGWGARPREPSGSRERGASHAPELEGEEQLRDPARERDDADVDHEQDHFLPEGSRDQKASRISLIPVTSWSHTGRSILRHERDGDVEDPEEEEVADQRGERAKAFYGCMSAQMPPMTKSTPRVPCTIFQPVVDTVIWKNSFMPQTRVTTPNR